MKNETDITFILDRSASMSSIKRDIIKGFNAFLDEQKRLPDPAKLSLVQFDHEYQPVYSGKDLQAAEHLTLDTFIPRGDTALLDAIGKTINDTGWRLRKLHENERPNRVIIVVLTDGQENVSATFTREQVFDMLKVQREQYAWEFVFVGASLDAIQAGERMGFANNAKWTADAAGSVQVMSNISRGLGSYRSGGGYVP